MFDFHSMTKLCFGFVTNFFFCSAVSLVDNMSTGENVGLSVDFQQRRRPCHPSGACQQAKCRASCREGLEGGLTALRRESLSSAPG